MEGGTRRSLTWLRPRRSRLCRVQLPALPPPPTRAAQPISARRRRRRWPMNRVNASPPSATGRQSTPFSSTASLSRDPARSAARGGTQRPAPNEKSQRVPLLPIRGRSTFPLRKGWAPTGGGGGRENNRGGITGAGGAPSSDRPVTRPPSPPPSPGPPLLRPRGTGRGGARGRAAARGGGRGPGGRGTPAPPPKQPPGGTCPTPSSRAGSSRPTRAVVWAGIGGARAPARQRRLPPPPRAVSWPGRGGAGLPAQGWGTSEPRCGRPSQRACRSLWMVRRS